MLHGRNAQGKTNLLEAVHLACTGRSLRSAQDAEMIRLGCEAAQIVTEVETQMRVTVSGRFDLVADLNGTAGTPTEGELTWLIAAYTSTSAVRRAPGVLRPDGLAAHSRKR